MRVDLTCFSGLLTKIEGQKKTLSRVPLVPARHGCDTLSLSSLPDKAVIKYLQTVDAMALELVRMLDDYAMSGVNAGIRGKESPIAGEKSAGLPAVFVFFPARGENETSSGQGQLIMMKSETLPDDQGARPGFLSEESALALAGNVASAVTPLASGLGFPEESVGLSGAQEKFIIIADIKDNIPTVSAIRWDGSWRREHVDTDNRTDDAVSDIIGMISKYVGPPAVDAVPENGDKCDYGVPVFSRPVDDAPTDSVPFHGYPESMKVSAMVAAPRREQFPGDIDVPPGSSMAWAAVTGEETSAGSMDALPTKRVPGTIIHDLGKRSIVVSDRTVDGPGMIAQITRQLTSLASALTDGPAFEAGDGELPDNGPAMPERANAAAQESAGTVARKAFQTAAKQFSARNPETYRASLGIGIDERGDVRIDSAVLSESLSLKKEEAVILIRDLAASVQNSIRYDFNPLAAHAVGGVQAKDLEKPGGKESAQNDNGSRKAEFEKRLSEVQLLLKSSYALKDAFMQVRSLGGSGTFDETDR